MNAQDDPFADSLSRILAAHASKSTVTAWPDALWRELEEAGFTHALVPEARAGSGLDFADAFGMLAQTGEHATPAPLAEAMIARWLAALAAIEAPRGFLALAAGAEPLAVRDDGGTVRVSGELTRVSWARSCAGIVTIGRRQGAEVVVLVDPGHAGITIEGGSNLALEPRDHVSLIDAPVRAWGVAPISAMDVLAIAAAARSVQIAGALRAVLASTLEYANLRVQFGRALSGFQVIQHQMAALASQTAMALAAAQGGLDAISAVLATRDRARDAIADYIPVASAKICAGEAAGKGAAIAHQVFGAIGFTEEHALHLHTRRLWSWRDEFGGEAYWSARIGASIIAGGAAQVWTRITASAAAHAEAAS